MDFFAGKNVTKEGGTFAQEHGMLNKKKMGILCVMDGSVIVVVACLFTLIRDEALLKPERQKRQQEQRRHQCQSEQVHAGRQLLEDSIGPTWVKERGLDQKMDSANLIRITTIQFLGMKKISEL